MSTAVQKVLDMARQTRDDIEWYSEVQFRQFEESPALLVRPEENMLHTFDELVQQLWGYTEVIKERLNQVRQNTYAHAGSIYAIMLYLHDSYNLLLDIFKKADRSLNNELRYIPREINAIHNNDDARLDLQKLTLEMEYKLLENRDRSLVIRKSQWENEVKLARRALLVGNRLKNQFIETIRSRNINAEQILSKLDDEERYFRSEEESIIQKQQELEVRRRELLERLRAHEEEGLRRLNANAPKDIWKGWTKSDIENLNSVFDTEEVPETGGRTYREMYAACPVCLAYVDRGEGCIYIQGHNCKEEAERRGDNLYHRQLYHKYKTETGTIIFCSICSRICQNEPETHLRLVEHNQIAEKTGRNSDPFARGEAGCVAAGGGGFNEKAVRFNAIRNTAFNLIGRIGQITKYQAFKEIVETAWDSPLNDFSLHPLGQFNRANNAFPAYTPEARAKKVIPRNGFSAPTILMEGTNSVAYIDDPPLIQFHHLDASGKTNNHEEQIIGPAGLLGWIENDHNHPQKCFSSACGGYLYPQEIMMALNAKKPDGSPYFKLENADKKIIQQYTKKFYENLVLSDKEAAAADANNLPSLNGFFNANDSESMFHRATDATCRIRGGKRRRKTRRMNKRRLQRKTRK